MFHRWLQTKIGRFDGISFDVKISYPYFVVFQKMENPNGDQDQMSTSSTLTGSSGRSVPVEDVHVEFSEVKRNHNLSYLRELDFSQSCNLLIDPCVINTRFCVAYHFLHNLTNSSSSMKFRLFITIIQFLHLVCFKQFSVGHTDVLGGLECTEVLASKVYVFRDQKLTSLVSSVGSNSKLHLNVVYMYKMKCCKEVKA